MAKPAKPVLYRDFIPTPDGRTAVNRAAVVMLGIEKLSDGKHELRMFIPSGSGRQGQLDPFPIGAYDTEQEAREMLAYVAQGRA